MAKPPDLEHLANQYLDLWQEQAGALAADPALAEAMSRLFGLASTAAATGKRDKSNDAQQHQRASGAAAARAAPAPAAPDAGGDDVGELARRLANVEERLAALEARVAGRGGGARGKPRRRSG